MAMLSEANQVIEEPVLLGAGSTTFGILTKPAVLHSSKTGVLIFNAGLLHNVGPFRLHVELSRSLAAAGYPVIRLDQAGKGESLRTGRSSQHESLLTDYDDAAAALNNLTGSEKIIIMGLCSGADDALEVAAERSNVAGIVMLDGYAARTSRYRLYYLLPRLLSAKRWIGYLGRKLKPRKTASESAPDLDPLNIRNWLADAEMKQRFMRIINNGSAILGVYTGDVEDYYSYQGQLSDYLALTENRERLAEILMPECKHTFPMETHRLKLINLIHEWIDKIIIKK
jgi:pimeloyl-ACP methyl ester carboxylesterase